MRQAINFAIDRDTFVKAALAGLAEPAYMTLPKTHWAYDKSVAELYPHDPDRARSCSPRPASRTGTSIELGRLSRSGFGAAPGNPDRAVPQGRHDVKFTNAPIAEASAAFFGAEKRGSGLLAAWTGRPDPSLTYSLMFTKDAYYNGGRAPVPPELEAAIKELRAPRRHRDAPQGVCQRPAPCHGERFVAPLAFQFELVAMNKKAQGYKPNLLGKPKYDDVWLES